MIVGIGIDIIEVSRVRGVLERHGDRFLRRIYSPEEIENVRGNRDQYLAARFAAKEAAFKALGTGWNQGVRWVDVRVENLASGQPVVHLSAGALARAEELGATHSHISITHTAEYAAAQVILERHSETGPTLGLRLEPGRE
ncbi:MAG: holo-ACP synthase [Candidatus Eisenbacteria bacterium]